ncbi:glycosyltransferase [Rhizobium sp. PAMB 3182]
MRFFQVTIAENDAVPSGASLRNRANFETLSTLWPTGGSGRIVALRADKRRGRKARTKLAAPLLAEDVAQLVAECLREQPDFVLVEGVLLHQAAMALAEAMPDLPIIIDMHNVESTLQMQSAIEKVPRIIRPLTPLILARQRRNGLHMERDVVEISRQVWVCSDADLKEAQRLFGRGRLAVVPNPIPDWARTAPPRAAGETQEVLFLGHLSYFPNRLAVATLCRDIMPRVRQMAPEARLHVCGRRPRRDIEALVRSSGHRLTANPSDLADVYAAAAVAAIPLRVGGGTRLKVLEAMAAGCPIVATTKAVEGLGLIPQEHYRLAETPEEFAAEIAVLLASREAATQMSERARSLVQERFGPKAHLAAIRAALVSSGLFHDTADV